MTSHWRVLDLSSFSGSLCAEVGAIDVVPDEGASTRVPVADYAVALIGPRVQFSAGVIHRLTHAGVSVLFCDWRGVPESGAYAWSSHTRVGARQAAQLALSRPRRKSAWGSVVRAKISGQANVLRAHNLLEEASLRHLISSVRSGDPLNVEAQAARIYWECLFADDDHRTPHRQERAGRNACLDYGYAVLRGHGIRSVLAAGLIPSIGLFHHGRSNQFNLVDDLIEPFRPAIDSCVFSLPADSSPSDREVKRALVAAVESQMSDGLAVAPSLTAFAQHIGQYVEDSGVRLTVPVWNGLRPSLETAS